MSLDLKNAKDREKAAIREERKRMKEQEQLMTITVEHIIQIVKDLNITQKDVMIIVVTKDVQKMIF